MNSFPNGLGLFIGAKSKELNLKYCYGQPQLKHGKFVFCNTLGDGLDKFGIGNIEFPVMFIDCEEHIEKEMGDGGD